MSGEFNGLTSLILKENECAFYVHCFAHQLQLTRVAVAKSEDCVASVFQNICSLLNVVGASCKQYEMLKGSQAIRVVEALNNGEICSGKGLHQERSLKRAGDTRRGSHYDITEVGSLAQKLVETKKHILYPLVFLLVKLALLLITGGHHNCGKSFLSHEVREEQVAQ
ncbi:unnamed protein product [Cuscuta epithymum]|uniref:DUF4371 domain-containing protein n=1 Tax=Cuscuta epithymum TaxID=186058 RepID=A0AAV0FA55_9ASTE|nr:unnamed protein product [Cuscuta epithymum]